MLSLLWVWICVYHSVFTALEIFSDLPMHLSLPPNPWQPLIFSVLVLPFIECHVVGIIQHVAFSDWFPSLSNMYLTFFYVFLGLDSSFLFVHAKSLQSCPTRSNPIRTVGSRLLCPWGFSRQEYWSGLLCPPPWDCPNPGWNPGLLCLLPWQAGF